MQSINLKNEFPTLFWDVKELDLEKHRQFIIERVLENGTSKSVSQIFQLYTKAEIEDVIKKSRRITRKTALFWQNKLNITEPIACTQKQSILMQKDHWNS